MDEFLLTREELGYVAYPKESLVFWIKHLQKYRIILPTHQLYQELLEEMERNIE